MSQWIAVRTTLGSVRHILPKCHGLRQGSVNVWRSKHTVAKLHATSINKYPEAKPLKLPNNLDGITHTETARWSPHRTRDMASPAILHHASSSLENSNSYKDPEYRAGAQDPHVSSYDCSGAVSLNSSMQTNVPEPYQPGSKSTHYNMPGGNWESGNKFIAEDMRSNHYINTTAGKRMNASDEPPVLCTKPGLPSPTHVLVTQKKPLGPSIQSSSFSINAGSTPMPPPPVPPIPTTPERPPTPPKPIIVTKATTKNSANASTDSTTPTFINSPPVLSTPPVPPVPGIPFEPLDVNKHKGLLPPSKMTLRQRLFSANTAALKQTIKQYGSTALCFHVVISLMSLGGAYSAVAHGLDVAAFMESVGLSDSLITRNMATNTGTFVAAYAVHKVFAPVRMATTVVCAPPLVKFLRNIGILKPGVVARK